MTTFRKILKQYRWKGLLAYLKIKAGKSTEISLPGIRNKICLREKTDDIKLFKQILVHKEYEFKTTLKPQFIIDAGSNIGLASLFFAGKYPEALIVAIEPEARNFQSLCRNTQNYPNIKPINAGLWHESTTLEVTQSGGTSGFMVRETNASNPNSFKAISTDDILKKFEKRVIDIFKIDIEGAEKEVLSENTSWLSNTKIMIIELHDRKKPGCSEAFFTAMKSFNFECHPFGQNFLLFNRDLI